jgi:hypothetical protein
MSRAGDFVDRTAAGRIENATIAIKPAAGRFESDCNAADATALPTNRARRAWAFCAMLLRAAHSCRPRLLCTGDVGIINEAGEIPPKFETRGSKRRNIAECRSKRGNQGMIEIILTVCAIANPANCEDKHLQFAWQGSIRQCMMAAQPYIAEWIGRHPEWMARKWTCDYPGHEKRDI